MNGPAGTFRPRPTLADVARLAAVSEATVSRALGRPDMVRAETLKRVHDAVATLDFTPAAAARALASGRSAIIGAIVPTLASAIFSRTLDTVQAKLSAAGYQLIVATSNYDPAGEAAVIRSLLSQGVAGLILVGADRTPEALALLDHAAIPIVTTWCGNARFDAVTVNNHRAGWLAARHLIDLGHRDIGFITNGIASNDRQRARVAGARDALEEAGLVLQDNRIIDQPFTLAGGRAGSAALLSSPLPPTAIIGGIDILAIGCIAEAHERGLTVPDDFSVVGIDNLDMAAHISPALTAVHIPTVQIGEVAADTLIRRLKGWTMPITIDLPVELIVRRSTGPVHRHRLPAGIRSQSEDT